MSRFYTIMVIPEKEKGVKSFRIPKVIFNSAIFLVVIIIAVIGILTFDYVKILKQVYENRHLSIENRQLKEQIQLFNMKLNTLTDDIERIQKIESKLRVISGFKEFDLTKPLMKDDREPSEGHSGSHDHSSGRNPQSVLVPEKDRELLNKVKSELSVLKTNQEFSDINDLYERKIATNFGLTSGYSFTKEWSSLIKQSFKLAENFAYFDYRYSILRKISGDLEIRVNELDQYLLDRESFLKSTPTLLPARGWITSYYGPRMSHYSKRVKMHEGLDVGGPIGTLILAPADGVVKTSKKNYGFGNHIEIDHGYGITTLYGHNSKNLVVKGQKVKRGDPIGRIGNSGLSTGPHLHYEIRVNGTPVDPLYYVLD
ncbi:MULTISPECIES: M23 family metallopeptidase [Halobacteriovorax]|uniref:M23 family metallopeptidase n=1 Tax=Halobacteriovorax vibrionivorans TaxID=2152716 RepID=A0ABY0IC67_9BACT|nr:MULTISPECIES: M23 family metallopeptidase [Halobacteriovorax]AYF44480.1 peptidase, M23 family [Halobacteriovorax sp. BALOs_7]RZF20541.1 M23 family metallopeptidase [Halobacteriovorax vibrionivorans]TGD47454.1 M23 family metallopeptidase [Halobacteriovorax sp. Y22]